MKTKLIFKLEKEPKGYNYTFVPDCKVEVTQKDGVILLDYDQRHPVGTYENLRVEGENVLADVSLDVRMKDLEHRFEYSISGVVGTNVNKECNVLEVNGVAALMTENN